MNNFSASKQIPSNKSSRDIEAQTFTQPLSKSFAEDEWNHEADTFLLPSETRQSLRRSISASSLTKETGVLTVEKINSSEAKHLDSISILYQNSVGIAKVSSPYDHNASFPSVYGQNLVTYGAKSCAGVNIEIVSKDGKCLKFKDSAHPTYALIHFMGANYGKELRQSSDAVIYTVKSMRNSIKHVYGPEANLKVTVVHNQNNSAMAYTVNVNDMGIEGPDILLTTKYQATGINSIVSSLNTVGISEYDNIASFAQDRDNDATSESSRTGIIIINNGDNIRVENGINIKSPETANKAAVIDNSLVRENIHYKTSIRVINGKELVEEHSDFTSGGNPLSEEEKSGLLGFKANALLSSGYGRAAVWKRKMQEKDVSLPASFLQNLATAEDAASKRLYTTNHLYSSKRRKNGRH